MYIFAQGYYNGMHILDVGQLSCNQIGIRLLIWTKTILLRPVERILPQTLDIDKQTTGL